MYLFKCSKYKVYYIIKILNFIHSSRFQQIPVSFRWSCLADSSVLHFYFTLQKSPVWHHSPPNIYRIRILYVSWKWTSLADSTGHLFPEESSLAQYQHILNMYVVCFSKVDQSGGFHRTHLFELHCHFWLQKSPVRLDLYARTSREWVNITSFRTSPAFQKWCVAQKGSSNFGRVHQVFHHYPH